MGKPAFKVYQLLFGPMAPILTKKSLKFFFLISENSLYLLSFHTDTLMSNAIFYKFLATCNAIFYRFYLLYSAIFYNLKYR